MTFALAFVAVAFVPWFFLSEHVAGATPLARCTAACPTNALMIANRPDVAGHFGTTEEILAVTFAVAAVVLLLVRFAVAGRARRRALAPVVAVGIVWLGAFAAYQIAAYLVVTDESFWNSVGWVLTGARIALPLAFLLALALAQMYAGGPPARMMRLRVRPDQAEPEQVAGEALGDPLRLASRNDDTGGGSERRQRRRRRAGHAAAWRELRSDGRRPPCRTIVSTRIESSSTRRPPRSSASRRHGCITKREMTSQLHDGGARVDGGPRAATARRDS